ncbi:FprA family A-type flavoprotein [Treponema phagedenis]|uniref:FprA family A-type flavoprotein n=1 Tax=Treponema phagedenis TaxID=162 RepID=UPI0002F2590E|nr:FprA family A-type flavoprotein [Treponema phagedenis]TYT78312.1 FprA family A-type flavoprotein [Treponema phagedenis]
MHCVRKVTDNLYWIGGNDHRTHLFENIHPIPYGVSYNSYVLMDEKTVVFDSVDWSVARQMLENLEHVLNGRELDYIVVNHLEPDHCSSMIEVLRIYPKCKIIATEKAFMLMHQFGYKIDTHAQIKVKEGDTYSFGKHTVTFVEAPMVHWPEVMITLDLTNGVLFSADAFGSFIALDGKLWNDDVNYDRDWIDETRRYFCNIVGKYGPHVQLLLGKAATVLDKIKIVCPLHGLIWRNNIMYHIDKYNHWSTYTPEEKGVLIVYASMYGSTENAAQCLASKICEKGMTNVKVCDVSSTHVSYLIADVFKYSHLVLASVTYNLGIYPVMENFLNEMKMLNMQNRTIGIIENGSWACTSGDLMQKFIEENMKNMTILNERLTLASALGRDKEKEIDDLAQAIIDSMNEEEK